MVKVKERLDRVPSGAVQFGSDWPGLFLRGDHASKIAIGVRQLQKQLATAPPADTWAFRCLVELAELIENEIQVPPP